ncbi:MAG: hypothetical protein AVDCRST_MAG79-1378, partial [uncultured Thermoleophilia bacterium]
AEDHHPGALVGRHLQAAPGHPAGPRAARHRPEPHARGLAGAARDAAPGRPPGPDRRVRRGRRGDEPGGGPL